MAEHSSSAFVQGEDSESDEEINTETMTSSMETTLRQLSSSSAGKPVPGVVAGEGSETDEEDDSRASASASGSTSEQTDGSSGATLRVPAISGPQKAGSGRSTPRSSRRSSGDSSSTFPPPSLLHKKLRERNTSLRRNIVERVLRIYHATCRNLTIVNDNLSRTQATIEKVTSHLKRAGQDLEKINITMKMTSEASCTFAPTLRMDVPLGARSSNDPSHSAPLQTGGPLTKTSSAAGAAAPSSSLLSRTS